MPRYEMANKFWDITLEGKSYKIVFGKLGTKGQTQLKKFASAPIAHCEYDKIIAEKTKKGYVLEGTPLPPPSMHRRDAKLEAAIDEDPDDVARYLVYADWLQAQGDPRGELIVLQHAKPAGVKKFLDKHAAHFFGKLADARDLLEAYEGPIGKPTTWRWGYLRALWLSNKYDRSNMHGGTKPAIEVADALDWLLGHSSTRFLRELTVGIVSYEGNGYGEVARVIGKHPLPTLWKLTLGDFHSEETELNWSDMGNISPLYKAVPNLESLTLRSGSMALGKIDLPKLRELRIISGGFDRASIKAILAAKWPQLDTLSIQLGRETAFTVKDLAPLLDGAAFPKLVHLGLGNTMISDAICGALAGSKIAARLESLDLSEGTMGDAGATALAAGKFPRLALLDVSDNYLTRAGLAALKKVAKKVDARARRGGESQRDDGGDPTDRYIAAFE